MRSGSIARKPHLLPGQYGLIARPRVSRNSSRTARQPPLRQPERHFPARDSDVADLTGVAAANSRRCHPTHLARRRDLRGHSVEPNHRTGLLHAHDANAGPAREHQPPQRLCVTINDRNPCFYRNLQHPNTIGTHRSSETPSENPNWAQHLIRYRNIVRGREKTERLSDLLTHHREMPFGMLLAQNWA